MSVRGVNTNLNRACVCVFRFSLYKYIFAARAFVMLLISSSSFSIDDQARNCTRYSHLISFQMENECMKRRKTYGLKMHYMGCGVCRLASAFFRCFCFCFSIRNRFSAVPFGLNS